MVQTKFILRFALREIVGLNSSSGKWTNQNFLIKFIKILVELARILIDIIVLVKIEIIKNIVSIPIPVISSRILILIRKLLFVHFQPEIFCGVSS